MKNQLAYASLAALMALSLAGCGSTPAQQQTLVTAGATLAAIAAQNNTTVDKIVRGGQLFCNAGGDVGIIAVINAAGSPASVTGQSADVVAKACAAFQAIPVAAPADPGSVPVQAMPSLPAVAP